MMSFQMQIQVVFAFKDLKAWMTMTFETSMVTGVPGHDGIMRTLVIGAMDRDDLSPGYFETPGWFLWGGTLGAIKAKNPVKCPSNVSFYCRSRGKENLEIRENAGQIQVC